MQQTQQKQVQKPAQPTKPVVQPVSSFAKLTAGAARVSEAARTPSVMRSPEQQKLAGLATKGVQRPEAAVTQQLQKRGGVAAQAAAVGGALIGGLGGGYSQGGVVQVQQQIRGTTGAFIPPTPATESPDLSALGEANRELIRTDNEDKLRNYLQSLSDEAEIWGAYPSESATRWRADNGVDERIAEYLTEMAKAGVNNPTAVVTQMQDAYGGYLDGLKSYLDNNPFIQRRIRAGRKIAHALGVSVGDNTDTGFTDGELLSSGAERIDSVERDANEKFTTVVPLPSYPASGYKSPIQRAEETASSI